MQTDEYETRHVSSRRTPARSSANNIFILTLLDSEERSRLPENLEYFWPTTLTSRSDTCDGAERWVNHKIASKSRLTKIVVHFIERFLESRACRSRCANKIAIERSQRARNTKDGCIISKIFISCKILPLRETSQMLENMAKTARRAGGGGRTVGRRCFPRISETKRFVLHRDIERDKYFQS